jgi:hypothetical protein
VDGVPAADGVTYVTIGDAGNREGHASSYDYPPPAWSAFRDGTQFGHGELTVLSPGALRWAWKRNIDGTAVATDVVYICNPLVTGGGPAQGTSETDCWPGTAATATTPPDAPGADKAGKGAGRDGVRGRLSAHARAALLLVGLLCLSVAVLGLFFAWLRLQSKRQAALALAQAQAEAEEEGGSEGGEGGVGGVRRDDDDDDDDDGSGGGGGGGELRKAGPAPAPGAGAGAGGAGGAWWSWSSWQASVSRMATRVTGRRGQGRAWSSRRPGTADSSHGLAMNASLHSEADVI